jgi:type VI secretion system peptidoglycan-associated protein
MDPHHFGWETLLQRLDGFLNQWQKTYNNRLDADTLTLVYQLYVYWRSGNEIPLLDSEYGLRLGPLICNSPEELELFKDLWQKTNLSQYQNQQSLSEPLLSILNQSEDVLSTSWLGGIQKKLNIQVSKHLIKRLVLGLILVITGVIWLSQNIQPPPKPEVKISMDAAPEKMKKTSEKILNIDKSPLSIQPKIKLDANKEEIIIQSPDENSQKSLVLPNYLFFTIPLLILAVFTAYIWHRRRVTFHRYATIASDEDLLHLKFQSPIFQTALIPNFSGVLTKLRFAKVGLKKINWRKTISATLRRGGIIELRFNERYRQIDFILLTDKRHLNDQSAWLFEGLKDILQTAQTRVFSYDYEQTPNRFWLEGDRNHKALTLEQLIKHHPNSRILLIAEHDALFFWLTGEIQSWLKQLNEHPSYLIGLLGQPDKVQNERLQKSDYRYLILNDIDNLSFLLDFTKSEQKGRSKSKIENHSTFDANWLSNIAPHNPFDSIEWLDEEVGINSRKFLSVLALYPQLEGKLTQQLYEYFKKPTNSISKRLTVTPNVLIKTTSLPWCRQGWLPDWLRKILIANMDKEDYSHAHQFFLGLFNGINNSTGVDLELDIHKPISKFRHLRIWQNTGNQISRDNPMHDHIFAKVMFLSPSSFTQLSLPIRLVHALPKAALNNINFAVKYFRSANKALAYIKRNIRSSLLTKSKDYWLSKIFQISQSIGNQVQFFGKKGKTEQSSSIKPMIPVFVFGGTTAVFSLLIFTVLLFKLNNYSDPVFKEILSINPPTAAVAEPITLQQKSKLTLSLLLADEISKKQVVVQESSQRCIITIQGDNLFDSGDVSVNLAVIPLLKQIAVALNQLPGGILITGHSDDQQIKSLLYPSNWHLTEARAVAVAEILKENLDSPERIKIEGKADLEPLAPNTTAAGRSKNRRVEITLLK